MIKYNNANINDWDFGSDNIAKVYKGVTQSQGIVVHSPQYISRDSSAKGFIDLQTTFVDNTRIQIKHRQTNQGGGRIIGADAPSDNDDFRFFYYSGKVMYDCGSDRIQANIVTGNTYEWEVGNYYIKNLDNNTNIATGTPQSSISRHLCLYNSGNTDADYGNIYYIKIYEGDTLIRDFIPWTDLNGNYGLFDKVSKTVFNSIGQMTGSTNVTDVTIQESTYKGNVIYQKVIDNEPTPSLPYDAEIEYLESDGTQYINTNSYVNTSNFEVGYSTKDDNFMWGWVHNNVVSGSWCGVEKSYAFYGTFDNNKKVNIGSSLSTENTIIYKSNSGVTVNDTFYSKNLSIGTDNITVIPLYIFGRWDFNINSVEIKEGWTTKLKSLYLKVNGELVRDMIPVRVGQVGYMYDKVSGQLFGNSGSGNFTLGNDK